MSTRLLISDTGGKVDSSMMLLPEHRCIACVGQGADIWYSTVAAGRLIQFKGTDLLTIDLASKKVENVTTSADLLNDYRALGYNLGVLNPS